MPFYESINRLMGNVVDIHMHSSGRCGKRGGLDLCIMFVSFVFLMMLFIVFLLVVLEMYGFSCGFGGLGFGVFRESLLT